MSSPSEKDAPIPPQEAFTGIPVIRIIESHNVNNNNNTSTIGSGGVGGVSTYPGLRRVSAVVSDDYTPLMDDGEAVILFDDHYEEDYEEEDDSSSCISIMTQVILWTMVTLLLLYNWMFFMSYRPLPSLRAVDNVNSIVQKLHENVENVPVSKVRQALEHKEDASPLPPVFTFVKPPQPAAAEAVSKDLYYDSNQLWGNTFVKHNDNDTSNSKDEPLNFNTLTAPSYHFQEAPQLDDDGMLLNVGSVYLSFSSYPSYSYSSFTTPTISFMEYSFDEDSRIFTGYTLMTSSFMSAGLLGGGGTGTGGIMGTSSRDDQFVRHEIQFDPEFTCIHSGRIVVLQSAPTTSSSTAKDDQEEEESLVVSQKKEQDTEEEEKETVIHTFGNDWNYVNAALLGDENEQVLTAKE